VVPRSGAALVLGPRASSLAGAEHRLSEVVSAGLGSPRWEVHGEGRDRHDDESIVAIWKTFPNGSCTIARRSP
jgi:hypothetical protein